MRGIFENTRFFFLVLVILTGFISCKQKSPQTDFSKQLLSSPFLPKHEILGVLDISRDTFIVISYEILMMTTNGGKTWSDISHGHFSYDLTIDNENTLWINRCWGGIHEPSVSTFYKSKDWGKYWETVSWDETKFLPLKIISKPHEQLSVKTVNNKIYKLTGKNAETDWKYIKTVANDGINNDANCPPYYTHSYSGTKLYKKTKLKIDTLFNFKELRQVRNLLKVNDTIYIAGERFDYKIIAHAYLAEVICEKKVKYFDVSGYSASIEKGFNNRIWVYNGDNLFLKGKNKLIKIY